MGDLGYVTGYVDQAIMTPISEKEGKDHAADARHLDDLPDAMDAMGWKVSARMMRRRFATRPAWIMPEEWRKGEYSPGQVIDYTKLPKSQVEDQIITMQWLLGFERVRPVFDELLREWNNLDGVDELKKKLIKAGWKPGKTVQLGRAGMAAKELDRVSQVNWRPFGRYLDRFDDLFGAVFKGTLKLAVVGKTFFSWETDEDFFLVDRLGVYQRDTYDFNADWFTDAFIGLGVWSKERLLSKAEMVEYKANVLSGPPGWLANGVKYRGFAPVSNSDFRRWQEKHNNGGDFFVFSDVMWMAPNVQCIKIPA